MNFNSAEWIEIKNDYIKRLQELRESNDGNKDILQTTKIRGKIELLKELISMPDKKDRDVNYEDSGW